MLEPQTAQSHQGYETVNVVGPLCTPLDILAEEIEHEAWFLELLYGRPSGHMRRKYSGERPHTRKHSRSIDMG